MNMKKILMLAASAALVSSFTGCFGSDDDETSSLINGIGVTVSGDTAYIEGTVTLDSTTDFGIEVNGVEVGWYSDDDYEMTSATYDFAAAGSFIGVEDLKNGTNTLVVFVYSYEDSTIVTTSDTITFTVTLSDTTDTNVITDDSLVSTTSLTLGAKSANPGSSVDLDSWTVLKASEITASNAADIDLVLYYDTDSSSLVLASPTMAKLASETDVGSTLQGKLVDVDDISIYSVSGSHFDDLKTVGDLNDLLDVTTDADAIATLNTGDEFIVTTGAWDGGNEGIYYVKVTAVNGSQYSATIDIKALKSE